MAVSGKWEAIEEARVLVEVAQDAVRLAAQLAREYGFEWEPAGSFRVGEVVDVAGQLDEISAALSRPWVQLIVGPKVSGSGRRARNLARARRATESPSPRPGAEAHYGPRWVGPDVVDGRWQFVRL